MSVTTDVNSIARDEYEGRSQKLQHLKEAMPVFKEALSVSSSSTSAHKKTEDLYEKSESYAGRILIKREHGKSIFYSLQDAKGIIQVYINHKNLKGSVSFEDIKNCIDSGDYIWIEGPLFTTRTGELTIKAQNVLLLSKSLHPLPDKYHGLADTETRYRQRYLDLIANQDVRTTFINRSKIISHIRSFLENRDFIEVETPMLHPIPGGATARPFVTHHNALDMSLYLRIAPELYLKKLVVGGLERVYEINKSFRNEGVSTRHNPEFTMLEFYMAHQNYDQAMNMVEELLRSAIEKIRGTLAIEFKGNTIDFAQPFARLTPYEIILNTKKFTEEELSENNINNTLKKHNIAYKNTDSYGQKVFHLFETFGEETLIQPTFVINFPIETSPLAKRISDNPSTAARFELFIAGMEISNGYNELNDPFDQAERFKAQAQLHSEGDSEAMHYDESFIQALEYGLPPTAGVGIGIDRLCMLATDSHSIKDVILFPTMKHKD